MALTVALVGGEIHTMTGSPIARGTILIDNGKVSAVGTDIDIPENAHVIQLAGSIVTPGLIDAWTQLGLVEISGVDASNDTRSGLGDVTAFHRVIDSYNADSSLIPIQRIHGVTTVLVVPSGGLVSGAAAVFDLSGPAPVVPNAGLVARLGGQSNGSRGSRFWRLRALFDEAIVYGKNKKSFERNQYRDLFASRLNLEAVLPVANGRQRLFVRVDRRADIRALLDWAVQHKIKLVLVGAREAWLEAKRIAKAGASVILDPTANAPSNFDSIRSRADAATILLDAGVPVAISTFSTHNVRKLRQWAGNAVRTGLSRRQALEAITRRPGEILGLDGHGLIREGSVANLVIWSGDPLEFASAVKEVYIRGERQTKSHRQRVLFDRYRKLHRSSPTKGSGDVQP
ncbi:MAG: amidohydrolase family protein [Myxococcota bacterium]|nr:amidohydrolase family protein [Myxococcota bacterium]